jgi:4-hydroxyphenylpyruvate dioxygenase
VLFQVPVNLLRRFRHAIFFHQWEDRGFDRREAGVEFLDTPDTYFEVIDQRIPNHGEDVARLARNKILIDADPETKQRKLLQIFTQNALGPIFFEIIQRKGNEGFGEGNFQALFESIERDQMQRGVL